MTRAARLKLDADGHVRHGIPAVELSNDLAGWIADDLVAPGLIPPGAFERTFVSVVGAAWLPFYRNTLGELARGGAPGGTNAGMAPCTTAPPNWRSARSWSSGAARFLSLRLARDGHPVTAVDLSPGTVALLASVAAALDAPLQALVGDAAAVPLADGRADTVLAVHLLEHLPPALAPQVVGEMLRVAGSVWWSPCRSKTRRTRHGDMSARSTATPSTRSGPRPAALHPRPTPGGWR